MEARTALVVALAGEEFEEPAWVEWREGVGGRTEPPEMSDANVKVVAEEGFASWVARLEDWETETRGGRAFALASALLPMVKLEVEVLPGRGEEQERGFHDSDGFIR